MQISTIVGELVRRRGRRELQAAQYGISADPVISIEIEDLNKAISALRQAQIQLTEREYIGDKIMSLVREACKQVGIDVDTLEV